MTKVASSTALPRQYVEGLFTRFLAMYGEKFTRMWSMADPEKMKAIWADDLGDLTAAEIKTGLAACRCREWPPTLPEFRNLCRAPLDYDATFYEAATHYGMPHQWSSPAVYWAAVKMGNDVRVLSCKIAHPRWKAALDWAVAHKANEPVPPHDQGRIADKAREFVPMPEEVKRNLRQFDRRFANTETGEVTHG